MSKKTIRNINSLHHLLRVVTVLFTLTIFNCAGVKPEYLSVLGSKPMDNTIVSAYPKIKVIYESDRQIVAVAGWGKISKSENHEVKWTISNSKGVIIYQSSSKNFTIQPHLLWSTIIRFDSSFKKQFKDGDYKVELYIDDKLSGVQHLKYVSESIRNDGIQRAVILPFEDKSIETNLPLSDMPYMLNTIASIIYGEVGRIIPDTIPHYVAKVKMGNLLTAECITNTECRNLIENTYGKNIFIEGSVKLVKYEADLNELKINVYSGETGKLKEFQTVSFASGTYGDVIHNLLADIMEKQGLLDYLMNIK